MSNQQEWRRRQGELSYHVTQCHLCHFRVPPRVCSVGCPGTHGTNAHLKSGFYDLGRQEEKRANLGCHGRIWATAPMPPHVPSLSGPCLLKTLHCGSRALPWTFLVSPDLNYLTPFLLRGWWTSDPTADLPWASHILAVFHFLICH